MKLLRKFCYVLLFAGACGFQSCGGKNEPDVPKTTEMTPDESKQYLEDTASEFLNYFKASDQKAVIELTDYLADNYSDYDAPSEFEKEYPMSSMKQVSRALRAGDYFAAASSAMSTVVNFDNYTGVYKVSGYRWVRVGDSPSIKFQFQDKNGQSGYLEITKDSQTQDEISGEPLSSDVVVYVPQKLSVKLVSGSTTYYTVSTTSSLKMNTSYDVAVKASFANVAVEMSMNAVNSEIKMAGNVKINNKQLIAADGKVNGRDMCDFDQLSYIEGENDIDRFFQTYEASATVLDKVTVKSTGKKYSALANVQDYYDYSDNKNAYWYDFKTEQEAVNACEKEIITLTSNLTVDLLLGGTKQASVGFMPKVHKDEWSSYKAGWVTIVPVLKFHDGTTYEFEEYFSESAFSTVVNNYDFIKRSYERLFN